MQRVAFPTQSPFLFRDLARGRARETVGAGELHLPAGAAGRRPAVVVLQGLGGLKTVRERAYGSFLAAEGYVTLVVDSFGPRGAGRLPDELRALRVTEAMLACDGYAALRFLAGHPAVDRGRIFVLGFSYGAMVSVLLAYRQIRALLASGEECFAGHVGFYGCSIPRLDQPHTTGRPILMLLGARDRNVSIARTRTIVEDLHRGGSPCALEILDGAYHQWDGGDEKKRFVRFNLQGCAMRMDRACEVYDEATGLRLGGPLSRMLALALGASLGGYHILRSETALARSNALLLGFLARAAAEPAPPTPAVTHQAATTFTSPRREELKTAAPRPITR